MYIQYFIISSSNGERGSFRIAFTVITVFLLLNIALKYFSLLLPWQWENQYEIRYSTCKATKRTTITRILLILLHFMLNQAWIVAQWEYSMPAVPIYVHWSNKRRQHALTIIIGIAHLSKESSAWHLYCLTKRRFAHLAHIHFFIHIA